MEATNIGNQNLGEVRNDGNNKAMTIAVVAIAPKNSSANP
jgi:hypothetical protein